ncbi:uncharacterized protein SPPG_08418 [Spizellomyces punctatus DAOM BR117]|uniref:HMG box domain-containing protein n=1 Tax=Spizellomyces punctatus (strain DAOM BR117) TaxID=645134 RepID=A0A0L0H4Y1_SPIPD|nr:uncharacterized protein SPPG_08418 [Spizellomyces punctatus DAOM BR117]KNC96267.1 hypothetical protein SPPG_08418 [Spizellomyces punctatus DAOM BR117]|eukprot:XP_016604307.1 hypothetical protein SPPG_08418 [Spizellomyces punctatus DAOM BR117]
MPPKVRKYKKDPALDAFMESEAGVQLFTALTKCADGIRELAEFVQTVLPQHIAPPVVSLAEDGKKKKRQKKERDPDAPKRPNSPFLTFSKDVRAKVIAANPELKGAKVQEAIGQMWRALDETEKRRYIENSAVAREEYKQLTGERAIAPTTAAKKLAPLPVTQEDSSEAESEEEEDSDEEEEEEEEDVVAAGAELKLPSTSKLANGKQKTTKAKVVPKKNVVKAEPTPPAPIAPAKAKDATPSKKKKEANANGTPVTKGATPATPNTSTPNSKKRKAEAQVPQTPVDTAAAGEAKKKRRAKKKKSISEPEAITQPVAPSPKKKPKPAKANV